MRKLLTLSIAAFTAIVVATTGWASAAFAAEPSITGNVVNGTASGGGSVGGLEVVLTSYVNSAPSAQQKALTDAQGIFTFSGLSTDASYSYMASVNYKNVEYASDVFQLTASNPAQTLTLKVYETTNSDQAVQLTNGHAVLFPSEQGLLTVLEAWAISNSSDRTYVGAAGQSAPATAHFTLPVGATNLAGDGFTLDTATGAATYAMPIIPGTSFASYTYALPYLPDSIVISRKMDYAIPNFGFLVPQQGITATSSTLTQSTPQDIQGVKYLYLSGANLKSGQDVDVSLTISPQAFEALTTGPTGNAPSAGTSWTWFAVGAVAVVGAFVAYLGLRRRAVPVPASVDSSVGTSEEEQALLEQIARLDDEFEAGQLPEPEYRQQRAQAKERLTYLGAKRRGR